MASEATAVPMNAAWLFTGTSKNPSSGARGPEGTGSADCSAPSWHELFSRELPSQKGSRGAISAGSHFPCASGGSSNDATGKNREAGPREMPHFGAFRNLSLAVPPHGTGRGGGRGSAWAVPRAMELQHSLSLRLLRVVLPRLLGQLFQQPHAWAGQHEAVNPCPALSQMGSAEPCLPPSTLPAAPDGPSSLALAG